MASTDVQQWFDAAPESQRPILDTLRRLILSSTSDIVEEIKWSRPCYSTSRSIFCYLHRTKRHVTIGFQQGASLKDPRNLLEGTGKEMRHVKVGAAGGLDQSGVLRLVKQAAKLA
jgi:hypothetical protein